MSPRLKKFLLFAAAIPVIALMATHGGNPGVKTYPPDNIFVFHLHDTLTPKFRVVGCKSMDDAAKVDSLIRAKDQEAYDRFAFESMRVCRFFDKGQKLTYEDSSFSTFNLDDICVRKQGDPDCYWINAGLLQRDQDSQQ